MVGFADFVLFATLFGTQQTDAHYDARFDLDASGYIGFTDFILFAAVFGRPVETT